MALFDRNGCDAELQERARVIVGHVTANVRAVLFVILAFDSAELVKLRYKVATIVGNNHIEGDELLYERLANTAQQVFDTSAILRGHGDGWNGGRNTFERESYVLRHQILFVQRKHHWTLCRVNLFQHLFNGLNLTIDRGVRGIDDVDEQIRLFHLFQCGTEGGDERGGQALHETHCISEQEFLSTRQAHTTDGGV